MRAYLLLSIVAAITVVGCATRGADQGVPASEATTASDSVAMPPAPDPQLQELREKRLNDSFAPASTIAPLDVVQVSVPDVDEIKDKTERVSLEGTIALPIAGPVFVAGLTEQQANEAI
jgi:protein involved in polysaccharide export with SLBB domain